MDVLKGADGVVCVGWKAGQELARVVASCDIMVAPSEVRGAWRTYRPVPKKTGPHSGRCAVA